MYKKTSELFSPDFNQEVYGDEELPEDFLESIEEKGVLVPLTVTKDGKVISGNRRLKAAKQLGIEEVPVHVVEYENEVEEREALIEYNRQRDRTFSQKMNEAEKMEKIEKEKSKGHKKQAAIENGRGSIKDNVADITGIGSKETYRKARKVWEKAKKEQDKDAVNLIKKLDKREISINKAYNEVIKKEEKEKINNAAEKLSSVSKSSKDLCKSTTEPATRHNTAASAGEIKVNRGEWWQLGNHYLYCGDTSSRKFVDNLPKAAFAFADPPYNANVDDWDNNFNWQHDWLIDKAETVAVTPGIESIFEFANITEMPYRWSVACWIDNGMTRGKLGFGNWIYVALFNKEDNLYRNSQDHLRISIKGEYRNHKGQKPAKLVTWLMNTFTNSSNIVIDPFLGSGTTLLAAEELNRKCYGGEISPEYCTNIIKKWEELTGKTAQVVSYV